MTNDTSQILGFVDRESRCNRVKKNQLDVQLILSIFRQTLHVSVVSRPIISRYNRMYTTIGTHYNWYLILKYYNIKMRRTAGYFRTDYKTNVQIAKELKITQILDKLLEYKRNWIQHVNRMPRNRLPRVMKGYSPTGSRNHGRLLKRLLDTWDRNGSTSGPTPWQIYDDDDDELVPIILFRQSSKKNNKHQLLHTYGCTSGWWA